MQAALATLDLDGPRALEAFRRYAQTDDRRVEGRGAGLLIHLHRGTLSVTPQDDATRLCVQSPDAVGLQLIRDMLAQRLDAFGIAPHWDEDRTGSRPGNQSLARVLSVTRISPSYSRVVIEGPDLARFDGDGLHFRLLFGPAGADWPVTDANGVTRWPGEAAAWHRPVYTTRQIEADSAGARGIKTSAAARLTFDVFRHDGGRVTTWCDSVAPGTEVALTGPGGGGLPDAAGWVGLVGDETALPVMARILSSLPAGTRGEAVLFIPDARDAQDISHPDGIALRWVLRGGSDSPLATLRALPVPQTDRYVFFAGERSDAVLARAWLPAQGLARGEYVSAAYWSRG